MYLVYAEYHYSDVIISAMPSQIIGVSIVCSTVCSGADQRQHQSSVSLAFVRGIHRWPVDFLRKGLVARKMLPFDDVIIMPQSDISVMIDDYSVADFKCSSIEAKFGILIIPLSRPLDQNKACYKNGRYFADGIFQSSIEVCFLLSS